MDDTLMIENIICPHCNIANRETAQRCARCGKNLLLANRFALTKLVEQNSDGVYYEGGDTWTCQICGNLLNSRAESFCPYCGAIPPHPQKFLARRQPSPPHSKQAEGPGQTWIYDESEEVWWFFSQASNAFPRGQRLTAGFSTHRGLVRENNQDALLVSLSQRVFKDASSTLGLLAVADGMGGHLHGELASQSAINTVFAHLARSLMQEEEIDPRKYQPEVIEAVSLANRRIRELGPSGENSPGTTLTLALVVSRRMIVANVGDSRTFLYRGGQLRQVSVDHSAGRSQLTRDLGHDEHVKVDIFDVPLEPGDRIMLCSDGLWSMLSESDLTEVLQTCADPQAACATLVAHANQAGGDDNITVVIADIANQF